MKPLKNRHRTLIHPGDSLVLYVCPTCLQNFADVEVLRIHECDSERAVRMSFPTEECNKMATEFVTKDSGQRQEFITGMKRDVQTDKPRYDLIGSGWDLIKRWAELVGRGAVKYGELNFEKAATEEEYKRFRSSAMRHMVQWFQGETDEDHAAAVCFNVSGAEMVRKKLNGKQG